MGQGRNQSGLRHMLVPALFLAIHLSPGYAHAGEARVAVAANFTEAARELGETFQRESGHRLLLSFGATGQFYAQIAQGAPFDLFLAADRATPAKAVQESLAVPGTTFTYAVGRLVLYSRDAGMFASLGEDAGMGILRRGTFQKLAIANPETAPYGQAAIEVMKAIGVHEPLKAKVVMGTSIAQTFQFVASGNAELGFVALSQVVQLQGGSRWIVPARYHAPIAQDAVLLKAGASNDAAGVFLAFLKGARARAVIQRHGYGVPD